MSSKSEQKTPSSTKINSNGTDDHDDDDGADLLYADLAALSVQPTLSSSSTNTTSSSSPTSSWHLWRYDCPDFPGHRCKNPTTCVYCTEVNKLRAVCPNGKDESAEKWPTYLKRDRAFDDAQQMLEYVKTDIDNVLPSKLARDVFFNCKLGTAFFRAGISPIGESPENRYGVNDQMKLSASTGAANHQLVESIDAIFVHTIRLISELPEPVQKCINGVLYRCEIHPGRSTPNRCGGNYRDHTDLPILAKLEVWIKDAKYKGWVRRELTSKIEAELQNLGVPKKAYKTFFALYLSKYGG